MTKSELLAVCQNWDTDLFGISNPESEMMKLEKLSPFMLKGKQKGIQKNKIDRVKKKKIDAVWNILKNPIDKKQ